MSQCSAEHHVTVVAHKENANFVQRRFFFSLSWQEEKGASETENETLKRIIELNNLILWLNPSQRAEEEDAKIFKKPEHGENCHEKKKC